MMFNGCSFNTAPFNGVCGAQPIPPQPPAPKKDANSGGWHIAFKRSPKRVEEAQAQSLPEPRKYKATVFPDLYTPDVARAIETAKAKALRPPQYVHPFEGEDIELYAYAVAYIARQKYIYANQRAPMSPYMEQ